MILGIIITIVVLALVGGAQREARDTRQAAVNAMAELMEENEALKKVIIKQRLGIDPLESDDIFTAA